MSCKKCPHHVRHGQVASDGKTIEFHSRCGLRLKDEKAVECQHFPFQGHFDYMACEIYLDVFKSTGVRNSVVPTSDFQYSEKLANSGSLTDMDLL